MNTGVLIQILILILVVIPFPTVVEILSVIVVPNPIVGVILVPIVVEILFVNAKFIFRVITLVVRVKGEVKGEVARYMKMKMIEK